MCLLPRVEYCLALGPLGPLLLRACKKGESCLCVLGLLSPFNFVSGSLGKRGRWGPLISQQQRRREDVLC